jgi:hypothetical protein
VQVDSCTPFSGSEYVCGSYNVRVLSNVDVFFHSFYDMVSGELVAIVSDAIDGSRCVAGPTTFARPSCPETRSQNIGTPCDGGSPTSD